MSGALLRRASAAVDRRVRSSWSGPPGAVSRLAAGLFAAASTLRDLLYDAGVVRVWTAPIPVVSLGGLTIGGSGKTPVTADVARRLGERSVSTAVLTHGYADELDVHRTLCPEALLYGGRDRLALARRAAADGAEIAVVDSGFQYRRLRRDLDIVVLDQRALARPVRRLPAGPYRESLAALARADMLVVTRRGIGPGAEGGPGRAGPAVSPVEPGRLPGCPPVLFAHIEPVGLVAGNHAAVERVAPRPRLAVAGVMWPSDFFTTVRHVCGEDCVTAEMPLPDHAVIDGHLRNRLVQEAGTEGVVCTLKDLRKLVGAVRENVPVWYVEERVVWRGRDGEYLLEAVRSLLRTGRDGSGWGREPR